MRIIPAIDIIDGQCVRLVKGDFQRKSVYSGNPVDVAKRYEESGIKYLHLVDLDGAKNGSPQNLGILEQICTSTSLIVDFGGGISKEEDIQNIFNAGASQVNIGSLAHRDSDLVKEFILKFSVDKVIIAADVLDECIAVDAWQSGTNTTIYEFLEDYLDVGLKYVVCTDISKDGTMEGTSLELYKKLKKRFDIRFIASGGVKDLADINKLQEMEMDGVIIGKAIYEGAITLKDLTAYA